MSWILKIKSLFFSNISANQISDNSKSVNRRHVRFGSITSLGKGCNGHCAFMASHRKCMVKILIGCKYCQTFKQKYFSGSSSTTNEPNLNIVCNCIDELYVLKDLAQCIHTVV